MPSPPAKLTLIHSPDSWQTRNWGIHPVQAIPEQVEDTAQHLAVTHTATPRDLGKKGWFSQTSAH